MKIDKDKVSLILSVFAIAISTLSFLHSRNITHAEEKLKRYEKRTAVLNRIYDAKFRMYDTYSQLERIASSLYENHIFDTLYLDYDKLKKEIQKERQLLEEVEEDLFKNDPEELSLEIWETYMMKVDRIISREVEIEKKNILDEVELKNIILSCDSCAKPRF